MKLLFVPINCVIIYFVRLSWWLIYTYSTRCLFCCTMTSIRISAKKKTFPSLLRTSLKHSNQQFEPLPRVENFYTRRIIFYKHFLFIFFSFEERFSARGRFSLRYVNWNYQVSPKPCYTRIRTLKINDEKKPNVNNNTVSYYNAFCRSAV